MSNEKVILLKSILVYTHLIQSFFHMKKTILSLSIVMVAFLTSKATTYTVTISGFSYNPSSLNVVVGDTVNLPGSSTHPLVEVDKATWGANGNTPLTSGFGVQTSSYMFIATTATTIFYVCQNHVGSGMKGSITINQATGMLSNSRNIDIDLYPNPVLQGRLHIHTNDLANPNYDLLVFDLSGRIVYLEKLSFGVSNDLVLETGVIARGTYILQMTSKEGAVRKKISIL